MNLPSIITNLFDTAARRRDQVKSLEAKLAELRAEYEAAIASGADDLADKIAAKIVRTQAEAAAARNAIETAERQAREQQADEAKREQAQLEKAHAEALEGHEGRVLRFEALAGELLTQWHIVQQSSDDLKAKATAAHADYGCESPMQIWNHVFIRFLQGTQIGDRSQMVMPLGRSPSRKLETLAERFARKHSDNRAAAVPQEVK